MDSEFERCLRLATQSLKQLEQIYEVIREILDTGIPNEPERLRTMITVLGRNSQIHDTRMLSVIWRLQQDLICIVAIYDR